MFNTAQDAIAARLRKKRRERIWFIVGGIPLLLVGSGIATAIAAIPTMIFLAAKHSLAPTGFWERLIVYGLGFYFLAGIQLVLLILLIGLLATVWIAFLTTAFD